MIQSIAMNRNEALIKFQDYVTLKNYSESTKKSYLKSINSFLDFCQLNRGNHSNVSDYAKAYLVYRFNLGLKWTSVNVDYSAIRILCAHVFNIEWDYKFIPRPRGRRSIPTVLSTSQVERMINLTRNIKHKTILLLFYCTGIRISELVNLHISDILFDRLQLKVILGKGGKDRIVSIPQIAIDLLRIYLDKYKPKVFVFEGQGDCNRYSRSSIHKIVISPNIKANLPFEA